MKLRKNLKPYALTILSVLVLAACGNNAATSESIDTATDEAAAMTETKVLSTEGVATETVIVTDIHGEVEVPVNPERVVSLDSRTYQTLEDWGVSLVAAPKDVMPAGSIYLEDESVVNIGDHREPDFESMVATNPDLLIVGQRFVSYYDELKELLPETAIVDFSFDLEESENTGENLENGFKMSTVALGKIFERETEAQELCDNFDAAIQSVKDAYNGTDSILTVVVSSGAIGYSAPRNGRVWGPMYQIFDFVPALEIENSTSDHQGDDISIEAIAQTDPDWIFVLDRDASMLQSTGSPMAKEVIEGSPALQNLTALGNGHILYAPNDTYANESIQKFTEVFLMIAELFQER